MAKKRTYSKKTFHSKIVELKKAERALAKIQRKVSSTGGAPALAKAKNALIEIQRIVTATRLDTSTPPPTTAF